MKVLVIVDCQEDFVNGALGTPEARAAIPRMKDRIESHADGDTLILFTKDTHNADYEDTLEGKKLPVAHCQRDTRGWSLVKEISKLADGYSSFYLYSDEEVVRSRVLKETFGSTKLMEILKAGEKNISEIVFMGFCTDICVISNVLMAKAFLPNIPITVEASCCAGSTIEKHYAALAVMESCHINVVE